MRGSNTEGSLPETVLGSSRIEEAKLQRGSKFGTATTQAWFRPEDVRGLEHSQVGRSG